MKIRRDRILLAVTMALVLCISMTGYYVYSSVKTVPVMFKLNNQLATEGYFTAEFEFKMLGIAYYLDHGKYLKAFTKIHQLHDQLVSKQGLVKVPTFADKNAELGFYLNLQNPRTGAFMDDDYPYATYYEPTMNMLGKLQALAEETQQPLELRYPLKFLDQINTEETLTAYLDDLSTVGKIASNFKAPFILAAKLTSYKELERSGLYSFSSEWEHALLSWFFEHQDSKTGFWGPELRGTNELFHEGDLGPTYSIVNNLFLDDDGNNIHPEFPLRYRDQMFTTVLKKLDEPTLEDASLDEVHDWSIASVQGVKLLTTYLWQGASVSNKESAKLLIEDLIRIKFEKFYIPDRGAFSLYPESVEPDLDGTGAMINLLGSIGAFGGDQQELLWGSHTHNVVHLGVHDVREIKEVDFASEPDLIKSNSIRVYAAIPSQNKGYVTDAICVVYPNQTAVLDAIDLSNRLTQWINTTSQSMGMWTPYEQIKQQLSALNIPQIPVTTRETSLDFLNDALDRNLELTFIGFDALQNPRSVVVYRKIM